MKFQHKDLVIDLSILKALQGSVAVLSKNGDVIVLKEKWGDGGLSSNWFDIEPKTDNYNLTTAGMPLSCATNFVLHFLFGILNIIQMKKRSKFALEEERRFLKTAPNGNPGIFFVLNTGKNLIRWNDLMFAVPLALLINERVNL